MTLEEESPNLAAAGESSPGPDGTVDVGSAWLGRIAATEGLFVTDEEQRIRGWSAAAQKLLGYTPEQVVGRLCYEVITGNRPDGHPICGAGCRVTRNARRGRGTASYPVTAVAADGTPRYLDNTVLVLEEPHGSFRVVHLLRETCAAPPARPSRSEAVGEGRLAEPLTRRELEVLRLFARGATLAEVAAELSISPLTARNHATSIQHKLDVKNRLNMVLEGLKRGLV